MGVSVNSGLGHGSRGFPQGSTEEMIYDETLATIDEELESNNEPLYSKSPKHDEKHGWGSSDPIKTQAEGQELLDSAIRDGKQAYNITSDGTLVKFQPANTPENEYHAYEVSKPRDVPSSVLKQMLNSGKISRAEYNRLRKGKK